MTNQEKFIQIFGIYAWQQMIVFIGLAEQFKEYWTSPYNKMNCRDCKEYEDCPCGKDGHESGTSQGYSIGECKDFEPQESEEINREEIAALLARGGEEQA
jgi:hypothetical protein